VGHTGQRLDVGDYDWAIEDPVLDQTIKAIGWYYLCVSDDVMTDRAHFLRAYEALLNRYSQAETVPLLAAPGQRQEAVAQLTAGVAETLAANGAKRKAKVAA
jgi:hypothetical protein